MRYASNEYRDGDVEMPVQEAIARSVPPDGVFFDVGANIGFMSLVASRAAGPSGTIVAFEARPEIAAALERNLHLNGVDARVYAAAVSDSTGTAELLVAHHPGGSTTEPERAYDTVARVTVPRIALDDLIGDDLPLPDVVKLDVEGGEVSAIRGMRRTLERRATTLIFEVDAPTLAEVESHYDELTELLAEIGYTTDRLAPGYPGGGWHVLHGIARPSPAESACE